MYETIFQHGNVGIGMMMSCRKADVGRVEDGKRHYNTENEIEDEDDINQFDFKEAMQ
jgi:hypothetical protein